MASWISAFDFEDHPMVRGYYRGHRVKVMIRAWERFAVKVKWGWSASECKTMRVVVAVGVRNAEYERLSMLVGWRVRDDKCSSGLWVCGRVAF